MQQSTTDGLAGRARTVAMAAVALSVLLSVLDYAIANVALPTIAHDIHASDSASIWVVNAYQLASLLALLPVAALGDILGAATLCRIGLAVFMAASALCALSNTLPELAAARVLQGLGGACIMGVNVSLVRFIYPAAQLGRGIALNGLVIAVGVALGPTVASAVLSVATWPYLFWINLPLGAAALLLAITALPATPRVRRRFDALSALLLALGLGPLVVGLDSLAHHGGLGRAAVLIVVGGACFSLLIRRELARPAPLFPIDLLRLGGFRSAFSVGFIGFIASNFFIIAMPFFLEAGLGRSPVQTGLLMTPWASAVAVGSILVGRIADRASPAIVSSVGLLVTASGFLLLRVMSAHPSDLSIVARIALAGFGFGIFQPPNNRAMMITAPFVRSGAASGMVSGARLFGQTLGAMLVASVFALLPGGGVAPRACMGFGAAVAVLGACVSATRSGRRDPIPI
jgi:DHA2 family multidrug resistance protein-like MFS transporter